MPFWLAKLSVSPGCNVFGEIDTEAPVKSLSLDSIARPESTGTADSVLTVKE